MRPILFLSLIAGLILCLVSISNAQSITAQESIISFDSFLRDAHAAQKHRAQRRISEDNFIELAKQPNTVVLDTRSSEGYRMLHIKGAKHLNFSDITMSSLEQVIPDKDTTVIIYCNNNFKNSPQAFPTKIAPAALNIPTFITLYSYGYKNIYEFKELVDPSQSKLEFEGSLAD